MRHGIVCTILLCAAIAMAGQRSDHPMPVRTGAQDALHISEPVSAAKSDTVYIYGGPGSIEGKFQAAGYPSQCDWQGWTSVDMTANTESSWQVDLFNSPTGTAAAWCGEVFAACDPEDPPEGYGNSYEELLVWTGTVDAAITTDVTVVLDLNHDIEIGYDYLYLDYDAGGDWTTVATWNGSTYDEIDGVWEPLVDETVVFLVPASALGGPGGDELRLRFRATSDGAWSDADCLWPTAGHSQLDDISVSGTNGLTSTFDDFESGLAASNWEIAFPTAVGGFAQLWSGLSDLDPCVSNTSCQVIFVDDGVVNPCTGGTPGMTWTYGPGGYTHNLTGGCIGPSGHAMEEIWSPPVAYDDAAGTPIHGTHEGAVFAFDVYEHLPIANGMFWIWRVNGSTDGGLTFEQWVDRNFVYYGPALYEREEQIVGDLLPPGTTHVRMALGINELGWVWGLNGTDGTPGPYFDNISFAAYVIDGPSIIGAEHHMAQDAFPASGILDWANPAANAVRFDMAMNIDGSGAAITPGDSLVFDVTPRRSGATRPRPPRLYYAMKANPLFDPYRLHPTFGYVEGDSATGGGGYYFPEDRFAFDLPDEDFFFPGDVIHYYIEGVDEVGGDVRTATLPSDLSAFGVFPGDPGYRPLAWPEVFTVNALPSLASLTPGDQPPILLYDDDGTAGGLGEWRHGMDHLGYVEGVDYDVYRTNASSSIAGNELASRATAAQIDGYATLLYSSGSLDAFTLVNGDPANWIDFLPGDDLGLLTDWLQTGRNALITGDHVVDDLWNSQGTAGRDFLSTWMGCQWHGDDIVAALGGGATPLVVPLADNPVGWTQDVSAHGACPDLWTFDWITADGTGQALASWASGVGPGVTPVAHAAVLNEHAGSRVITVPADFAHWWSPPGYAAPAGYDPSATARDVALAQILAYFGEAPSGAPTDVATPMAPSMDVFPNPFNPAVTIEYAVPRRGAVVVRIYDVRGALVRTLVDEVRAAGLHRATWRGDDDAGRAVASGVYFARTSVAGETLMKKLTLMK